MQVLIRPLLVVHRNTEKRYLGLDSSTKMVRSCDKPTKEIMSVLAVTGE
jgi:hypothetical protein